MRVYMAPCGIGLGHVTRAEPIAKELNKRGVETIFSTYLDGIAYAKRNHLRILEAVPINFKVTSNGAIDFKMTAATSGLSLGIRRFLRQMIREIRFIKSFKPDVVFSDSRASSLLAARLLRIPVVLMLNQFRIEIIKRPSKKQVALLDRIFFLIANLGWIFIRTAIQLVWVRSQIILIPDLLEPYTIALGNLAIPRRYNRKVRFVGPIVTGLHSDHAGSRRHLGFDLQTPLIYAAVSGPRTERQVLSNMLMNPLIELSKTYNVVLSTGEPNGQRSRRVLDRLHVYDWIENQNDFIYACDVIVSRAGHGIMMKSILYGKPMVLIPIPDHTEQYGNARRAVAFQIAEYLDQTELNSKTLKHAVEKILDSQEYNTRSQHLKGIACSMDAIGLTCDIITSLGRKIQGDCAYREVNGKSVPV